MEDFFNRLDKYMAYSDLNDNKLTVRADLSIGSLGKQRKGSRGLSSESIAKILCSCANLNAEWLLTGRGEMIKSDIELQQGNASGDQVNRLLGIIESQQRVIENLSKKTDARPGELANSAAAV